MTTKKWLNNTLMYGSQLELYKGKCDAFDGGYFKG